MKIQSLCVSSALLLGGLVSSTQAQCSPTEISKHAAFSDENHSGGQFAKSLAISGNKAIVGAPGLNSNRGRIFFYTVDGTQMLPHSSFRASGDGSGDSTSESVDIDGDIAVIGAPFDDDFGSKSGSAYIFRYDGVNWNQETKLLPSDGASKDFFGHEVAISGNVVVIGARHESAFSSPPGAAYVFRYDGASWVEEAKLLASDGEDDDQFGSAVAIEGNTIVIGADNDDAGNWWPGSRYGSAYIFNYDGANWSQGAKIIGPAEDSIEGSSSFGASVGLSGSRVVIGQIGDDADGTNSGAAYIYGTDGVLHNKIKASDVDPTGHFGSSVALIGDTLVVGAQDDLSQGAAYLYKFDGASWVEAAKMVSADITFGDWLGKAVAISGDTVLIGASSENQAKGSFYVFDQGCAVVCLADLTGDGLLNFFDISAFLQAFGAQDSSADFNGDGLFNFFDISDFLAAFAAGCP